MVVIAGTVGHKHTTNTPRLNNTIFNNGRYTTKISTYPHTVTTTDIKTNMHHIHQKGHILDLVITREHSNLLKRPPVVFISGVSDVKSSSSLDHFAVLCYLNVNRPKTIHKSVKFRAFRNIPVPDYRNDVKLLMCNRRKPQKNIMI